MKYFDWAYERFNTIALIVCVVVVWAGNFGIIDIGPYYLVAYFGIPFFYICRKLDQIEEKVSLKVSRVVALLKEDEK